MQKWKFFDFWKWPFYLLERMVFSLKHYLEVFPGVFGIKTNMHESLNVWPKSWVNPFAKMQIFRLYKMTFLYSRKDSFLSKTLFRSIPSCFRYKNKHAWNFKFLTKIMGWPLCKNANFFTFSKWPFYSLKRLVITPRHYKKVEPGVLSYKNRNAWKFKFLTKIVG